MAKKFTKQGNDLALVIDKSLLASAGIDEKTDIEILVVGGNLLIKPRVTIQSTKKREEALEASAKRILDKYGPVFKKLANISAQENEAPCKKRTLSAPTIKTKGLKFTRDEIYK